MTLLETEEVVVAFVFEAEVYHIFVDYSCWKKQTHE
jgi:hypothetical protein